MDRVFAENRVVLSQLQPVGSIPFILGGNITAAARFLGAFQNNLYAISFCHYFVIRYQLCGIWCFESQHVSYHQLLFKYLLIAFLFDGLPSVRH